MKKRINFAIFIVSCTHIMSSPETPQRSFSTLSHFQKNSATIIQRIITSTPACFAITITPIIAAAHYVPFILAELAPRAAFGGLAFSIIIGGIAGKAGANIGEWLKKLKKRLKRKS